LFELKLYYSIEYL